MYSLNTKLMSYEFSLAYKWDKAILKANFDSFDLADAKNVFGETISLIVQPTSRSTDFCLYPEVGAGIAHGRFSNKDSTTVKPQVFVGTVLNYNLGNNLDIGALLRFTTFGKDLWNFYLGPRISAKF